MSYVTDSLTVHCNLIKLSYWLNKLHYLHNFAACVAVLGPLKRRAFPSLFDVIWLRLSPQFVNLCFIKRYFGDFVLIFAFFSQLFDLLFLCFVSICFSFFDLSRIGRLQGKQEVVFVTLLHHLHPSRRHLQTIDAESSSLHVACGQTRIGNS